MTAAWRPSLLAEISSSNVVQQKLRVTCHVDNPLIAPSFASHTIRLICSAGESFACGQVMQGNMINVYVPIGIQTCG